MNNMSNILIYTMYTLFVLLMVVVGTCSYDLKIVSWNVRGIMSSTVCLNDLIAKITFIYI